MMFPPELEREIFEIAALSNPTMIPTLLRVARRVLIWIEPLLFRVIRLDSIKSSARTAFVSVVKSKSPDFLRNTVRHALMDLDLVDMEPVVDVLRMCPGIVDLVVVGTNSSLATLLPILADMRLERLTASLCDLFGTSSSSTVDLTHPLFASITHLDIIDHKVTDSDYPALWTLPSMTHLSLEGPVPWPVVQKLLADCPHLRILLLAHSTDAEDQALDGKKTMPASLSDARLVMLLYGRFASGWEASANGRWPDYWSAAADFVARRSAGSVEVFCYWPEPGLRRLN